MAVNWVRLALDLEDEARLRAPTEPSLGVTLTSLQELGDSNEHRHLVYELNKTCSADIPERGEFFTFEEYAPLRFEAAGTRLDGLVLAFDQDRAVGLCQLTCPPDRPWAFIEMTGVLRAYPATAVDDRDVPGVVERTDFGAPPGARVDRTRRAFATVACPGV